MRHLNAMRAKELVDRYGTPLYVYDQEIITANYHRIHKAFADLYGNFKVCYAVKANNNLAILSLLKKLGAGFDCSSKGEIYLAQKTGSDFMIYTGNYNSDEELAYALGQNVHILNLDDIKILDRVEKINAPQALFFRVNSEDHLLEPNASPAEKESKFGIPRNKIIQSFQKASALGVTQFGLHMMGRFQCLEPHYFIYITDELMQMAVMIKRKTDIDIAYIDIGGGFGIPYRADEKKLDIEMTASGVTDVIKGYVGKYDLIKPTLIIEPGRYIVGDAGYLLGKVHHIKDGSKRKFVGTDIGMNVIPRISLFDCHNRVTVFNNSIKREMVTLCGQICMDRDVICKDQELPVCHVGDIIMLQDAGAYGYCHSSQFNTRERPAEVLLHKNKSHLIRKREDLSEFDRLINVPDHL